MYVCMETDFNLNRLHVWDIQSCFVGANKDSSAPPSYNHVILFPPRHAIVLIASSRRSSSSICLHLSSFLFVQSTRLMDPVRYTDMIFIISKCIYVCLYVCMTYTAQLAQLTSKNNWKVLRVYVCAYLFPGGYFAAHPRGWKGKAGIERVISIGPWKYFQPEELF